jgi:flagellar basal body-associated protein FliL
MRSSAFFRRNAQRSCLQELLDGINEALALEEPPVTSVLFTEFIIQ